MFKTKGRWDVWFLLKFWVESFLAFEVLGNPGIPCLKDTLF